jgi:hypothetical protein
MSLLVGWTLIVAALVLIPFAPDQPSVVEGLLFALPAISWIAIFTLLAIRIGRRSPKRRARLRRLIVGRDSLLTSRAISEALRVAFGKRSV